jgi:hypothetical protein
MHYFWWRSRLLWIERNCTPEEKKQLYRNILVPELWKMARHYLLKAGLNVFCPNKDRKDKARRMKAGCAGALDFFRSRFGNCPKWLLKRP